MVFIEVPFELTLHITEYYCIYQFQFIKQIKAIKKQTCDFLQVCFVL